MTIDEAIENLKLVKKKGVKSLVLAYWTAEDFNRNDDAQWADDSKTIEKTITAVGGVSGFPPSGSEENN